MAITRRQGRASLNGRQCAKSHLSHQRHRRRTHSEKAKQLLGDSTSVRSGLVARQPTSHSLCQMPPVRPVVWRGCRPNTAQQWVVSVQAINGLLRWRRRRSFDCQCRPEIHPRSTCCSFTPEFPTNWRSARSASSFPHTGIRAAAEQHPRQVDHESRFPSPGLFSLRSERCRCGIPNPGGDYSACCESFSSDDGPRLTPHSGCMATPRSSLLHSRLLLLPFPQRMGLHGDHFLSVARATVRGPNAGEENAPGPCGYGSASAMCNQYSPSLRVALPECHLHHLPITDKLI